MNPGRSARGRALPVGARRVGVAVLMVLVTACASSITTVSPSTPAAPSGSAPASVPAPTPEPTTHVLGIDWGQADVVDAPPGDANGTQTPYENPGSLGHPQHYQGGQADLFAVASTSEGLVAVGYLDKEITADAWHSVDGRRWSRILDFPAAEGSQAVAVTDGPRGIVAVGHQGNAAAAWHSVDGQHWERATGVPGSTTQIQMTSVTSDADGYVAVGYLGSLVGPVEARFWWSPDGLVWTLADPVDGAGVAASRAVSVSAVPGIGFVAVGATGDARTELGSAAWTSTDGRAWTRVAATDALAAGVMRAVTVGAGEALVAVGNDAASARAMAWRSADGRAWEVAPDAPSLDNFGLKIEMRAVAWDGTRYLAGGHRLFGTQFPTGLIWTSPDGVTWTRATESAALSQGRVWGVTASLAGSSAGARLVAVGTYGSPDFAIPTVWLSPP